MASINHGNDNDNKPISTGNTKETQSGSIRERIGLSIPAIGGTSAPTMLDLIVQAEQAGVKQVWATQNPSSIDVLTAYAAAFQRTNQIRLGTSIVPIYGRHPLILAQQAATAAALGSGRLRLGVGTSHRNTVEGMYGIEMSEPLAYLKEYVQVLHEALSEGGADYKGRFLMAKAKLNNPQPVPVLTAALRENAFRLAGEVSDGAISWNVPPSFLFDVALPALHEGARSAGRSVPPLVAHVPVVLSTDEAAAYAAARKFLDRYSRLPYYTAMWEAAGYPLQPAGAVSDRLVDDLVVMGDEAAVASRLLRLLQSGLDELLLSGIAVGDPAEERTRLMRLVGQL